MEEENIKVISSFKKDVIGFSLRLLVVVVFSFFVMSCMMASIAIAEYAYGIFSIILMGSVTGLILPIGFFAIDEIDRKYPR